MKYTTTYWIILVLSVAATLGSLYIGRYGDPVANLMSGDLRNPLNAILPCSLCRYMRVFQYPLIVVAIVGLIIKERSPLLISALLSGGGLLVAGYKMSLEYGRIESSGICTSIVSCSDPAVMYRGWLSLPLMGLMIFGICIATSILSLRSKNV